MYIVYIQINADGVVTAIDSSAFLSDSTGWVEIDEGEGDKYHHAQGNYLPLGLMTDDGIYNYKYADGAIQERSAEEIQADREAQAVAQPLTLEMLAECILEMSEYVYR